MPHDRHDSAVGPHTRIPTRSRRVGHCACGRQPPLLIKPQILEVRSAPLHLVQRLGVEQGYNLAKETGRDLEEGIACATAGLRRRFAARVWRDYYKHVDARRRYANPTDEGLAAQQRDRQIEEESRRRENEERVAQYNYFAARASNRSAWARAGMG